MAAAPTIQIPQLAIVDVDGSRPQTPVLLSDAESSAPSSPTAKRMDSLKVDDVPAAWRRSRSLSVSTMDTLPTYSGPGSPKGESRGRKRSNSMTPSISSEAPSYRTIPDNHDSTTYHLYRLGPSGNIAIHEVPDVSLSALPRATFADGTYRPAPGFWRRTFTGVDVRTSRRPDNPKFDPRMATYYVHRPYLPSSWKSVPFTLRVGPNKNSPIACRFDGSFGWRKWGFDFEDINGEGVVDERGVIAEHYPRKRKIPKKTSSEETEESQHKADKEKICFAGPAKRALCPWSPIVGIVAKKMDERKAKKGKESPKIISSEPKEVISTTPNHPAPVIKVVGGPLEEKVEAEDTIVPAEQTSTSTPSVPTSKPSVRSTPVLTIDTSKTCEPTPPPTPSTPKHSNKVEMIWENKIGRQYSFTYKDVKFSWKGTSTLKDTNNKYWGAMNRFSHLKLVAELPEESNEVPVTPKSPISPKSPSLSPADAEKPGFLLRRRSSISSISSIFSRKSSTTPKRELVVATYTVTMGKRKAGRLHVDNAAIEKLVRIIAEASPTSFSPIPRRRSSSFTEGQYLSPDSLGPPTRKRHAHVFPTPRLPEVPVGIEIYERKRLRELTVATCVAMANSEQEKRHFIVEVSALALEIVQNVATG